MGILMGAPVMDDVLPRLAVKLQQMVTERDKTGVRKEHPTNSVRDCKLLSLLVLFEFLIM